MATLKNIKCTYLVGVCQRTVILVHEKFYDGSVTSECCSQHRCHTILYIEETRYYNTRRGRASKDSHITTSRQHKVLQNINLLTSGHGIGACTPCAVVQPKMHSELHTYQNTIILLLLQLIHPFTQPIYITL